MRLVRHDACHVFGEWMRRTESVKVQEVEKGVAEKFRKQ
jgi:hypothetical protein